MAEGEGGEMGGKLVDKLEVNMATLPSYNPFKLPAPRSWGS